MTGRRIKVRTSRPWDNTLSDDPKVLRIAVKALEKKLQQAKLELTAANELIRSYRRSLEGKTGASRPSPNNHPSRQVQTQVARRAALVRAMEGLGEERPVPPPAPPSPPNREGFVNPSERTETIIRDGQGRVLEQNEIFESMSDAMMAQMRQRDLMVGKLKIGAIIAAMIGVAIGLFFFDAKAIYEWFTNG